MAEVMIFSPHPDDAELGMGGTIARLIAQGVGVALVDVTSGEPTPYGDEATRAAGANLALGSHQRENLGLPNRWLEETIENRKLLAAAIRRHRPRILFIPYALDAHPDHLALHVLATKSRFDAQLTHSDIPGEPHRVERIVHFYCTHLRLAIVPTFLVDISAHAQAKRKAIDAYQSQFYAHRPHPGELPDMVMQTCAYFGSRAGVRYAEPFHTDEPILVSDLGTIGPGGAGAGARAGENRK
jgi:bacillithiol biosynthesis deacetylase BshB1